MPLTLRTAEAILRGRRVLVTGHTGFSGGWLSLWLNSTGCDVSGLALPPNTEPNLFTLAGVGGRVSSQIVDIRDAGRVDAVLAAVRPEVVLHLAAQPLVRRSYSAPVETFASNVLGTVHVLEAARTAGVKVFVAVTTDKVYRNLGTGRAFVEGDELGGHDPYSASKAAAEMAIESYQRSFGSEISIAAARGGNIIGGGDWSEDRLIPDAVRAIAAGKELELRNPGATRPWQHVLALCHGYILLAATLLDQPGSASRAYNFGPDIADNLSVGQIVELFCDAWRGTGARVQPSALHEAELLALDSRLARDELGWKPAFGTVDAVRWTAQWYRAVCDQNLSASTVSLDQIARYRALVDGRENA